jgi:hypothetical protein
MRSKRNFHRPPSNCGIALNWASEVFWFRASALESVFMPLSHGLEDRHFTKDKVSSDVDVDQGDSRILDECRLLGTGFAIANPNPVNPVEVLSSTTSSEGGNAFFANNPIFLVQDNDPRLMESGFFQRVVRKIHDGDAIADRAEVSSGAV